MYVLGIDTSCDDTSASVLDCSPERVSIVRNVVSSQTAIHTKYGGIVPELASRSHIEMIWPVTAEAMGGMKPSEIGLVAVCHGPGLIGSLLVGCSFVKAMCYAAGLEFIGVNHLEGHILSPFLEGRSPEFPFLSLVVSGGHTSIYKVSGYCDYAEIGRTRDDAAGEAYDKVSKMLGLGYPGGPIIDRLASEGNPHAVELPRAYLHGGYDFSFSGLKTAVRLAKEANPAISDADMAASFQASVIDVLARKCEWAIKETGIRGLAISGGVAANSGLRSRMAQMAVDRDVELYLPSLGFCTDNAAMIALSGYRRYLRGERSGLDLNPRAYMPVAPCVAR